VRGFPAQADRDGFIETANGICQEGVKFDSLRFGITEFAIGAQVGQVLLLERFFGLNRICLNSEAGMAGDEAEHSDSDVFRLGGGEHFLNHLSISGLPIRMQDAGVDSEADAVAVLLAELGSVDSLVEVSGIQLVMPDCFVTVYAPGDDRLVVWFEGKQVIDIRAFCEQHKEGVTEAGEEGDERGCQVRNVVEGERIEHFAHIEAGFVQRAIGEFGYLSQHRIIVDVDFDEGVVFSVYGGEITVGAAIGTAIGDGNEFVIRATADSGAEPAVEAGDERRGLANYQGILAFENCLADGVDSGRCETLLFDNPDRRGWEQSDYASCLVVLGDFSPEQNCFWLKGPGCIQGLFSKSLLF